VDDIIPNGVAILQYADYTIIFMKHGIEEARNMELLLYMYEMMAGLKINFNLRQIFGLPVSPSRLHWLTKVIRD
jgi:hypothetical protein